MTPPRVVPFAPSRARAQSTRARRGFHPATDRVSPTRPRSRVTDARDGERRWNFHSTVRARHRAVSRVALCGRARARERARINDSTRDRRDRDPRDHTGGVPPTRPRTDRAMSAPRHSTATRRASSERTNETRATTQTVDPSEPASRGARGDDGRTREGGGERRDF